MNSQDIYLVGAKRLETFFGIPGIKASDKVDLTTKGFYALPESNKIKCIRCTEMFIIIKESVPIIRGHNCNRPFHRSFQNEPVPYSSSWTGNRNDLFHEEFRVATFLQWEYTDEPTIKTLAKSGFYLTLNKNLIQCCYCNFSLREASKGGSNATRAHLIFHPECVTNKKEKDKAITIAYLKKYPQNVTNNEIDDLCKLMDSKLFMLAKEMGFSDKDIRLTAENRKTLGLPNFRDFEELLEALPYKQQPVSSAAGPLQKAVAGDAKICVICMDSSYDTLLYPCNHLAVCSICVESLTNCPMCRVPITGYVKVFLS